MILSVIDTVEVSTVNSFSVDTVRVRSSGRDTVGDSVLKGKLSGVCTVTSSLRDTVRVTSSLRDTAVVL